MKLKCIKSQRQEPGTEEHNEEWGEVTLKDSKKRMGWDPEDRS